MNASQIFGEELSKEISPDAGAEFEVADRHAGQAGSQIVEEAAFVVLRQFLLEDGAADFDFEDAAAEAADAGLAGEFRPDGFAPSGFETRAFRDAAPTAGDEEPAEHIGEVFGTRVGFGHGVDFREWRRQSSGDPGQRFLRFFLFLGSWAADPDLSPVEFLCEAIVRNKTE